ncbi:BTAD domain-containing putative transcriptional regulator [Streptosporangium lutulentum]
MCSGRPSCREALALWRGRAFAGLDDVTPLAEAAERLEQDRRRVLTERIDVDLVLGRHAEIIPELISMVAENPLVESAAARLMVAMHRSGQRTEALETYRRTRAVLAEELGLEPGPQLRALEAAILRGDAHIGLDLHAGAEPRQGRPRPRRRIRCRSCSPPGWAISPDARTNCASSPRSCATAPPPPRRYAPSPACRGWARPRWPYRPPTRCGTTSPTASCT